MSLAWTVATILYLIGWLRTYTLYVSNFGDMLPTGHVIKEATIWPLTFCLDIFYGMAGTEDSEDEEDKEEDK